MVGTMDIVTFLSVETPQDSKGLQTGAAVGITFSAIILVIFLVLISVCIITFVRAIGRRKKLLKRAQVIQFST